MFVVLIWQIVIQFDRNLEHITPAAVISRIVHVAVLGQLKQIYSKINLQDITLNPIVNR